MTVCSCSLCVYVCACVCVCVCVCVYGYESCASAHEMHKGELTSMTVCVHVHVAKWAWQEEYQKVWEIRELYVIVYIKVMLNTATPSCVYVCMWTYTQRLCSCMHKGV